MTNFNLFHLDVKDSLNITMNNIVNKLPILCENIFTVFIRCFLFTHRFFDGYHTSR